MLGPNIGAGEQERSFAFDDNIGLRISGKANNQAAELSPSRLKHRSRNPMDAQNSANFNKEQSNDDERVPWSRGISGRHPSASNDKEGQDRALANKRASERGQSAVAIGGRQKIGITDRTAGDLDRLISNQKLAHKSI